MHTNFFRNTYVNLRTILIIFVAHIANKLHSITFVFLNFDLSDFDQRI